MHLFKQIVDALSGPLTMALIMAALAVLIFSRKRPRVTKYLLVSAAVLAYLSCLSPVGDALLYPLERRYIALRGDESLADVRYIAVLGSGYSPGEGLSEVAALDTEGLARVVEGLRLARRLPSARLVFSGGAPRGRPLPAIGYAKLAAALGVPEESVIVLSDALDTGDEAGLVSRLVGSQPFLLVTSAFHMPRAMRLMQASGARPIAAPTAQRINRSNRYGFRDWLPASKGLRKTELALHEYLGLAALAVGIS
jgi:uncharacterized SAM-binding protein YcdF (DUF218 family)